MNYVVLQSALWFNDGNTQSTLGFEGHDKESNQGESEYTIQLCGGEN